MTCASTQSPVDIVVFGAGSYGTALALCFARNGNQTLLWCRDPEHAETMSAARSNEKYLPNIPFTDSLSVTHDLAYAAAASEHLLVVIPSHAFANVLTAMKPHVRADAAILWATKGLEPNTGRLLQDVVIDVFDATRAMGLLSGPTFAKEMAQGLPTAISLSANNDALIAHVSKLLHCEKSLRVYTNQDLIGVQIGGVVKNIIAIGAGMADGIGFGANARTALITRGLVEMTRLGLAIGAQSETFMGMAGLGDLVLTCTDNQSRNRRFGLKLGQGESVEDAMASIGQVVEGYRNTKEVFGLAQRYGVEMPITEQVYRVLFDGKKAKDAAFALLGREQKSEVTP